MRLPRPYGLTIGIYVGLVMSWILATSGFLGESSSLLLTLPPRRGRAVEVGGQSCQGFLVMLMKDMTGGEMTQAQRRMSEKKRFHRRLETWFRDALNRIYTFNRGWHEAALVYCIFSLFWINFRKHDRPKFLCRLLGLAELGPDILKLPISRNPCPPAIYSAYPKPPPAGLGAPKTQN